jgi:geranylgeranyl pyrophosphate synthase
VTGLQGAFSLAGYLAREEEEVARTLGRTLDPGGVLGGLPAGLRDPVRHTFEAGGKRLRPILCAAAFRACGGEGDEIWELAVSLELIHAYSLMHDDLPCMDDAGLRRGRPTPHTVFGERATLLAAAALIPGAVLQAWRGAKALGLEPELAGELVDALALAAGGRGMVGGQALDLLGEGGSLGVEELDRLHRMKTGALLTGALRMGGLAARARPEAQEALKEYGARIGLAFQIADDVLDATSDSATLGKAPSDHDLGKSTYVALLGVEGARNAARREVRQARKALDRGGLEAPALHALADFVVARDR